MRANTRTPTAWWIVGITLLGLTLAACGGGDDDHLVLQSPPTVNPASITPAPPDSLAAGDARPTDGALLITRGTDLYLYPFPAPEGDDPELIAHDVAEDSVYITPERRAVLYASPPGRRYEGIYLFDLVTHETAQVIDLADLYISSWWAGGMSPDGEWLLINLSFMSGVIRLDDPGSWQVIDTSGSRVEWLDDGRVLVSQIEFEFDADGSPVQIVRGVQVFDPGNGTLSPVELDLEAINATPDPGLFEATLAAQGLEYPPRPAALEGPVPAILPPENGTSALCGTWRAVQYTPGDPTSTGPTLYTAEDVYNLTLMTAFDDGSLLVVESTAPECTIMDTPTGALKLVTPEGEARTLADNVFVGSGVTYNPSPYAAWDYVAVSPDQRYVVWIGGGAEAAAPTLHLMDLETGAVILLYREDLTQSPNNVAPGHLQFDAVEWINTD